MAWHAKATGEYDWNSAEAIENAKMAYDILTPLGWTLNAICAMWGNVGAESGYNPWRWQGDSVKASNGSPWSGVGYGLFQYTPAANYIGNATAITGYAPNFSDSAGNAADGGAQIRFMNRNYLYNYASGSSGSQYYPNTAYDYQISWQEFKTGDYSVEYLAKAWLHNFERPADQSTTVENFRASLAAHWYDVLSTYSPSKIPIWLLFKIKEANSKK